MNNTGKKLVELRGCRSQREIAEDIGISPSSIAMYEREERIPSDAVKMKLAKYFGRSVAELFFDEREV